MQVKWVGGKTGAGAAVALTPVVTQNENGPCPLLAIANILLARGQVELPSGAGVVTSSGLLQRIADCILRLGPQVPCNDLLATGRLGRFACCRSWRGASARTTKRT